MADHGRWFVALDERQQKEVDFAQVYARDFYHGTTGHNQLILIGKLTDMLDNAYRQFANMADMAGLGQADEPTE